MARKLLVRVLALWYLVLAFWYVVDFVLPIFTPYKSSGPIHSSFQYTPDPKLEGTDTDFVLTTIASLNCFDIIACIVLFRAGLGLFRFENGARKLAIFLSSLRLLATGGVIVWILSLSPRVDAFGWEYSGQSVFEIRNPYAFMLILLAWLLLPLFFMLFLMQKDTKKLFLPEPQITEIPPTSDPQPTATDH
jgi:hypothetical protein